MSFALASTAVAPAVTSAAVANVNTGGGDTVGLDANGATPTAVSPGKVAGFYIWAKNNDSANLSTFFLNATSDATPYGAYWWRSNDPTTHPCDVSNGLVCNFGAFNSGQDVIVLAAFTLPSATSTSTKNCGMETPLGASWVCVDFKFGSNSGFVPGKNNSRGDEYHQYESVRTDLTTDQAAQFPFCPDPENNPDACSTSLLSLNNGTKANKNDLQTTGVTAPFGAFDSAHGTTGIAVEDNFTFSCPAGTSTTSCRAREAGGEFLGQWARVDVNSEVVFGDWIRVDLTMYGVNVNKINGVVHLWSKTTTTGDPPVTTTTWYEEDITTLCPSADGPTLPPSGTYSGCYWASSGQGNLALVSVWIDNNGSIRTF